MRKKIVVGALLIAILTSSIWSCTVTANAGPVYVEPVKMRVTCYTATGNPTATGVMPFEGGCAAKRDWIGCVAVVYDMDMRLIGFFTINDTGGHKRIKSGTSIDIYRDTLERCFDWVGEYGDYCYVQIIPADG